MTATAVAFVAVLGAAQAAPQGKQFAATVHVVGGAVTPTSATLRLVLTNKTRNQTLGSANFTPPAGVTAGAVVPSSVSRSGWTANTVGGVVEFRSTGGLGNNESVSADVAVTIDQLACTNAAWTVHAKQANDFSGSGNDFQFDAAASDVVALGNFSIATIETVTGDGQHVPAILTGQGKVSATTAYDICGEVKTTYSGATRTKTLLTGASFSPSSGLSWSNGVGSVTITPAVTETDNRLTVSDSTSGITANSNFFDTTDRLCTSQDTQPCEWSNQGNKIKVNANPPPQNASLGIGFNSSLPFSCGASSSPAGGALVNINPRYEATAVAAIAVTLTYAKSVTPGSPNGYTPCFRKDTETEWTALGQCPSSPSAADAPCFISRGKVPGGDLEVVLWVKTEDPWTGLG